MSKAAKKMFKVSDTVGFACAGVIGDMQVLAREATAYLSIYRFERGREGSVRNAAKLLASLLSNRRMLPDVAQTIIGGKDNGKPGWSAQGPIGSVRRDTVCALGSGGANA